MISRLQMIGFAPDLDPMMTPSREAGPGIWVACDGLYPTLRGFRRVPSAVANYAALSGDCYGAYVAHYLDGTTKLVAGTRTTLNIGESGTWSDASGGQTFAVADHDRWRFAQFGNDTIGVNGTDDTQVLINTGSDFAALAGLPPIAKVVATVNNFVFLLNLYSGDPGSLLTPTMWWCSGIGDDTSWTPDIATQAANGYLDDTEGPIVGAKPLGRNLIVYKQKAVYLFDYLGPPVIWENRILSQTAGALSHEAVVDIGDAHVFMGYDDFYVLDGANPPQPIQNPLRRFIFQEDLNRNLQDAVQGRYDRTTNVVYWHYPSVDVEDTGWPQTCDKWVAWHRQSNHWTMGETNVQAVVYPELPGSTGVTYGGFGALYTTWGEPDGIAYDSYIFAGSTDVVQSIIQDDKILYTLTGQPEAGAFCTLGDFGDDQNYLFVRRIRPRYTIYPATAGTSVANYRSVNLGETAVIGQTAYLDPTPGWVNLRDNARFHRLTISFPAGDAEIVGIDIDYDNAGVR